MLILFFNLVFYHLKYFLWRKCRKICKKWKDLYFRIICVSENSCRAGAKQANWYSEVFGWVSEFNDIWWLHFCHAFSLPCLHCQFYLLCHSPTGSMLLESPRNPTSWVYTLLFLQFLELLQVMWSSQCSRLSKLPTLAWGCFLILTYLKGQTADISSSESRSVFIDHWPCWKLECNLPCMRCTCSLFHFWWRRMVYFVLIIC